MSPTAKPLEKLEAPIVTAVAAASVAAAAAAAAAAAEVETEKPMIPQKQRYMQHKQVEK